MKISVVTPSYNQGRFIQKCIESVRSQEDVQLEHIILDNCSSDSTGETLRMYRKAACGFDIKIIIEPDNGQTEAINRGFCMASGDVVCWLNTDEYYAHGALAQVVSFFDANPDIDILFGDCVFVDVDGCIVKMKREFGFSKSMLLYYGCYIPSCATFVRRNVIDAGHLLDESFRVAMDYEYWVRLAFSGYRFAHLPSCLANFTWHETNISNIQFVRRTIEERMVRDRYSRVLGPGVFRTLVYAVIEYSWIAVRVLRRLFRANDVVQK